MLALLHTSPVHVPVFDALRDEAHPDLELRHFVDEPLLDRARAAGPDAVAADVRAAVDRAVTDADAVVLAQASMAPAQHLTTTPIPVLASPRPGLAAGAEAARRG